MIDAHLTTPNTSGPRHSPSIPVTLGAGDILRNPFQTFGETLPNETFSQVMAGTGVLRFDGVATYKDVFDQNHTLKFGGIYRAHSRTFELDKSGA